MDRQPAIMEDYCLTSNLAPGTITYEERGGRTAIDPCLMTAGLVDRLTQCEIETDMDHDSAHLPITTSLDLNTVKMIAKPRRNWKALYEKTFTRVLQRELPPQRRSRTKTALDRHVEAETQTTQRNQRVDPRPTQPTQWRTLLATCGLYVWQIT
ncbi:hypothetical protein FPOAC2_13733 [Fusarium poae]